jgi:hypothetical protein
LRFCFCFFQAEPVPEWLAALPKAPDLPAPGQVVWVGVWVGGGSLRSLAVLPLSLFFTCTSSSHKTMIRTQQKQQKQQKHDTHTTKATKAKHDTLTLSLCRDF